MKKLNVVISALAILALLAAIAPAHAGLVGTPSWLSPLKNKESDTFYGQDVTGYEALTSATLAVNVLNEYSGNITMNVTAVKVWFDWGVNYTSDINLFNQTNPFVLATGQSNVFTLNFNLPDTTTASNLVLHSYKIYVDEVNATSGNQQVFSTSYPLPPPANNKYDSFAVFSATQAQAIGLKRDIGKYTSSSFPFLTTKGRQILQQALFTQTQGDNAYNKGDFTGAVTFYQNATSLYDAAWGNETGKTTAFEDAFLNLVNSGQNVLNMMGVGYALFGIGFLFMGIGVVVYLVRKSGQPKAQPQ